MANIKTYTAAPFSLTESDKGGQAWSQAGRRLGPLYNEAAQFTREAGKLAADNKAQLWPFDILELYQKNAAATAAAAARAGGGGGVRVRGGLGSDILAQPASYGPGFGDANGQISQGAAALGQSLNDGGQAVSRRQSADQQAAAAGAGEAMTLDNGNLVTQSASNKAFQQYQADQSKTVDQWTADGANAAGYWQQYNGNPRTDTSFDPSPIDMQGVAPPPAPSMGYFEGLTNAFSSSTGGGDPSGTTSGGF